jgi:hypothetical protein
MSITMTDTGVFDPILTVALRKTAKEGPQWKLATIAVVDPSILVEQDFIVEIAETRPKLTGPNKGRPAYLKPYTRCVVTPAEIRAARTVYEQETGKCSWCSGSGLLVIGWSQAEGTKQKSCHHCRGSGHP